MSTGEMLRTHPVSNQVDQSTLTNTIDTLITCAQTCTICADACLGEQNPAELRHCIRLNLDCADICHTTANLLSRQTEPDWQVVRAQVEACVASCKACGAECESHASHHEHCRVCAEHCRNCEEACRQFLGSLPA